MAYGRAPRSRCSVTKEILKSRSKTSAIYTDGAYNVGARGFYILVLCDSLTQKALLN